MSSTLATRDSSDKTTTMKVSAVNRDALAAIATSLGKVTLDEALGDLLFAYESMKAVERLSPEQLADWQAEADQWAEADVAVTAQ